MFSIFKKEINSFFSSIVGYVALLIFLVGCSLFLWIIPSNNYNMLKYGYASMDPFFAIAPWLLLLLVPAVTMRSLSEEFRTGTIEWLYTKPLRDIDIILGKYFAILTLVAFALLPTLVYVYTLNNLSLMGLDTGAIIGSYLGLFFLAATYSAIGIFCSSLTSNQVVGFLISLLACFMFYTGFEQLSTIPQFSEGIDYYLSMIGMEFHYNSISRGLIDSRDVVYFLSVIVLFAALTRYSLSNRTKNI